MIAALALVLSAAASPSIVLEADKVVVQGDHLVAEGNARLVWGAHEAVAERIVLDPERNDVVLVNGRWTHPAGVFSFERAEWSADERFDASGVEATRCRCEDPPWALSADRVQGQMGDVAVTSSGWLRLCSVPVVPFPSLRIPLDPTRPRLGLPELGFGEDGLRAYQPLAVPQTAIGAMELGPSWRARRGLSARGEVQSDEGRPTQVRGAVGTDRLEQRVRGFGSADHGLDDGAIRAAVRSTWVSDRKYWADFGTHYVERQTPWTEQLAVASAGPLRLESNTFDAVDAVVQRPIAGVLSLPGMAIGGLSASGVVRTDLVQIAPRGWQNAANLQSVQGALRVGGGGRLGPLLGEAWGEGRWAQWSDGLPQQQARVATTVRLPLWGDVGSLRHLADVGGFAAAATPVQAGLHGHPWERFSPVWEVGPVLRSRWLRAQGVPAHLEAGLTATPSGLSPTANGAVSIDRWSVAGQTGHGVDLARGMYDDAVFRLGAGVVQAMGLTQGFGETGWHLPGAARSWEAGWAGQADLRSGALLYHGPQVGYRSPCACLSLAASAQFATDRELPEVGLRVDLY